MSQGGYFGLYELMSQGGYFGLYELMSKAIFTHEIICKIQWNLIITVTLGPSLAGCYMEVAFLLSGIQNHHN